jgi:MutS domain V
MYRLRLAACRTVESAEERTHVRIGNARLATMAVAAVMAWLALGPRTLQLGWLAVPGLAFLILVVWHDRVLTRRQRASRAAAFYEQGIARLTDTWAGTGEAGERFLTADHPYAADLDLFGRGSLFELLTTARIRAGEERLAQWLLAPAHPEEVRARQEAVRELRPRLSLREDLAVLGQETGAGGHPELLVRWGAQGPVVTSGWPQIIAAVLAGLAVVTLALWGSGRADAWPFVVVGLAELVFSLLVRRRVRQILAAVEEPARDLALLAGVFERFERETFASPRLQSLRQAFGTGGQPPSERIKRLRLLIDLLNSRQNQIFAPVAAVTLWGTQMAFAVERWRERSGPHLAAWLEGIGDFEALCSLGGYAYEHPGDTWPDLEDAGACFDGTGLAHPLLPESRAVPNDVHLGGELRMLLVSGSNMSGKSTLLRTVGANAVLALAGAPVRATRLRLAPLAIGATLRIQDSLQAGQSRFYAEITRVRAIAALTADRLPVLFLLDELLSGTNSHDRQLGAQAIVRGLIDRGAIGLVTTHDLALSSIVEALAPRAANVHFADELEAGTLTFDYRMRPGIVRTSNALALMRAVGLEV